MAAVRLLQRKDTAVEADLPVIMVQSRTTAIAGVAGILDRLNKMYSFSMRRGRGRKMCNRARPLAP